MPVYSNLLYASSPAANTVTTAFTVPSGVTCVLRDIEIYNGSASTAGVNVRINVSGFGNTVVYGPDALLSGAWSQWEGRVVVPAGGTIQVFATEASVQFTLSGYELV